MSTLQESPQKHMETGTSLGRGFGLNAFPVNGPFLQSNQFLSNYQKQSTINPKPRLFHFLHINEPIIEQVGQRLPLFTRFTMP
jgi:hypothetical protein